MAAGTPSQGSITWSAQDQTARLLISNPGHLNAISVAMWRELCACFSEIAARSDLRVAVISGAAGAFAAGADIAEFQQARMSRDQVRSYHEDIIAPALTAIAHCPLPVVAAIDGACVGGGLEIACACDMRIATERSRFGVPINRLGFAMAPAEAAALVALVGGPVALELLLEGRVLDAEEAYDKGLVNRVVPQSLFHDQVETVVDHICAGAPAAARRNKWLIRHLMGLAQAEGLSPMQREASWDFADSQDYRRGVESFLNKTSPDFQDD
ncbi:MAG: enoyl-CoA hydratase/isomerase family protein [Burkholderiaceae bacterium]|nr:enoyl-CoA hydratase/isomerase family protein [Burkholderiaceae bacterium]